MCRFAQDIMPAMMKGFAEATKTYGALLDHIELAVINGFMYSTPRPVGAPKDAKGTPPKAVFKLLTWFHPEIRRRNKRAAEIFRDKYWRKELAWWDGEVKPSIEREAKLLLAEDPDTLPPAALAAHVRKAAEFARRGVFFHHRLNCCAIVPVTDFVVHATQWTGMTPQEVLIALRGRSPLSAGATGELDALRTAIGADGEAMGLLLSPRPPSEIIDGLRARPTAVGAAMKTYLDTVGLRVLGGYDVADRHVSEHPELLVTIIRTAVTRAADPGAAAAAEQAVAAMRARVPDAHRAEFDALFEEAVLTYRVRDERNFCSDAISTGVLRRALLAAGRRLRADGKVHDPAHMVDASEAEAIALIEGRGGPTADQLQARYTHRMTTTLDEAPERLGNPPSEPPPAEWLPAPAARMQRAIALAIQLMFEVPPKRAESGKQLRGFGVSPGVFEGPARVILDITELSTVQEGDVLVTPSTGPTFNVVLPLLRAIVTERGGALSHAAIVAREYGIPAVVGCPGATAAVTTGMRVRVDGSKGEMWVIG